MALSVGDRLKLLVPSAIYYRHKIRVEAGAGEPELAVLGTLLRPGDGMAIDVGANRGIYSYALSKLCSRVLAFEPNPDLARFARRKLPSNVEVVQIALGAEGGFDVLQIPVGKDGRDRHLLASLGSAPPGLGNRSLDVEVRRLDDIDTQDVRFIKIDVEGTELDVLRGARQTIARDRPVLMVELLVAYHGDVLGDIDEICRDHGYVAEVLNQGRFESAVERLRTGAGVATRNLVFRPRQAPLAAAFG